MKCHIHPEAPQFGCPECIQADRDTWAHQMFEAWKKTYKPPICSGSSHFPRCRMPMEAVSYAFNGKKLMANVSCTRFDQKQGWFPCADSTFFSVEIA